MFDTQVRRGTLKWRLLGEHIFSRISNNVILLTLLELPVMRLGDCGGINWFYWAHLGWLHLNHFAKVNGNNEKKK